MRDMLEEYGFDIITAMGCGAIFIGLLLGFKEGGFLSEPIVEFIEGIIGQK